MKNIILKNGILSIILILMNLNSFAQKEFSFTLKGKIDGVKKALLYKKGLMGAITDSVDANNGAFSIAGNSKDVEYSALELDYNNKSDIVFFILEPGNISFKQLSAHTITPLGTPNNNIIEKFEANPENLDSNNVISTYFDSINHLSEKIFYLREQNNPNKDTMAYYTSLATNVQNRIDGFRSWRAKKLLPLINQHPQTYFAAALGNNISTRIGQEETLKIYNNLGTAVQSSNLGKTILSDMQEQTQIPAGTVAPDFTTKDINGKQISLKDFRGKYVLLDFWATWCGPCRASNPQLIKVYNKYHDKGFDIIGISDDDNNIAGWKKAVKNDNIGIWNQVLRGMATDYDLSKLYNVHAYPTQYLIDKDGKIITAISAEDLDTKLGELLN